MSPGKGGMYLAKEEIAEHFGTGSYGNGGLGHVTESLQGCRRAQSFANV
jgi:hypothetical protein